MVDQALDVIPLCRVPWLVQTENAVPLCALRAFSAENLLEDLRSAEATAHEDRGLLEDLEIMLEVAFFGCTRSDGSRQWISPPLWENRLSFLVGLVVVVLTARLRLHAACLARPDFDFSSPPLLASLEVDVLLGFISRTKSFPFNRGEKSSTPALCHHLEAVPMVSIPPLLNGPWVWSKCSLLIPNPAEMVLALFPP